MKGLAWRVRQTTHAPVSLNSPRAEFPRAFQSFSRWRLPSQPWYSTTAPIRYASFDFLFFFLAKWPRKFKESLDRSKERREWVLVAEKTGRRDYYCGNRSNVSTCMLRVLQIIYDQLTYLGLSLWDLSLLFLHVASSRLEQEVSSLKRCDFFKVQYSEEHVVYISLTISLEKAPIGNSV